MRNLQEYTAFSSQKTCSTSEQYVICLLFTANSNLNQANRKSVTNRIRWTFFSFSPKNLWNSHLFCPFMNGITLWFLFVLCVYQLFVIPKIIKRESNLLSAYGISIQWLNAHTCDDWVTTFALPSSKWLWQLRTFAKAKSWSFHSLATELRLNSSNNYQLTLFCVLSAV